MAKKVCYLNSYSFGSTGNIVCDLSILAQEAGFSTIAIWRGGTAERFKGKQYPLKPKYWPYALTRLGSLVFDGDGFRNGVSTAKAISILEEEKPDLVHIHNVHGTFLNIEKVLRYCREKSIKVVWTLHDSWLVSGRCGYFHECDGWKSGCRKCEHHDFYPWVIFGREAKFYEKRRKMLKENPDILFISPSNWLKNVILEAYPSFKIEVIRNGINLDVFQRTEPMKVIEENRNGRYVVGFADPGLREEKGYDKMLALAASCSKENILFTIIGAPETRFEKPNVLLIKTANSQEEMASYYSSIDIFGDLTMIDNYPTTHLEALSCGTPVISYDVGGACEMLANGVTGIKVENKNLYDFRTAILKEMSKPSLRPISQKDAFDKRKNFSKYIKLYNDLLKD